MSEYKGNDDNVQVLKLSDANVAVYTAGGFAEFRVGQDGVLKVCAGASACMCVRQVLVAQACLRKLSIIFC